MPIFLNLSNLIVPKETINKKYKGRVHGFRNKYITEAQAQNQEDEHLFSIAGMNPDEFDIQGLIDNGLLFNKEKTYSPDFVIITRYGGLAWSVNWIEQNSVFAWHKDCKPEQIAKAQKVAYLSVNEIQGIFNEGGNPFQI